MTDFGDFEKSWICPLETISIITAGLMFIVYQYKIILAIPMNQNFLGKNECPCSNLVNCKKYPNNLYGWVSIE